MSRRQVWLNGRLVDADRAMVNVADRGFLSGDGVFEAIKVVDGRPFAVTRHLERLRKSAEVAGLAGPDPREIRRAIDETVAVNSTEHRGSARVRVTVTAGAGAGIHRVEGNLTLLVTVEPLFAMAAGTSRVLRSPWPRNERSALAGAKTTSYAENAVILAHARRHGYDEALMADTVGRLSEGTTCNVLVVHDGLLVTPTLATGCLAGVTRDLAIEWGIVRELDVPFTVLDSTPEVLLTSTSRDLQPVSLMGERELDAPGPIGLAAMNEFARRAALNCDP